MLRPAQKGFLRPAPESAWTDYLVSAIHLTGHAPANSPQPQLSDGSLIVLLLPVSSVDRYIR